MNFKVEIQSREAIIKKAKQPFGSKVMLITVCDPDAPMPALANKPQHILKLVFDDITPEDALERLELPSELLENEKRLEKILKGYNTEIFTDALADKTSKFIKEYIEEVDLVICQCEFGQSRSAAIACAILEYYQSAGKNVFDDVRYSPNKWVYNKLLAALHR